MATKTAKAKTYSKDGALKQWAGLKPRQDPLKHMQAIPYKSSGSTYGACGIRIDGTPEFIDAVLSNLQSLIFGEAVETRLGLSRREVQSVEINGSRKTFENRPTESEVCYIRLHERGIEGKMLQAFCAGSQDSFDMDLVV